MEINDDALDLCQNLLYYTYNAYFQERKGLQPVSTPYRIGEIVMHIFYVHNATFKRILLQNFQYTCKDPVEFLRCMVDLSLKIVDHPCQSFLASAALLTVYMYIAFDKKCYRFLQTSPLCLYIVLNRLIASNGYSSFSHFYRHLLNYSSRVHVSIVRLRSLAGARVEPHAPEPVQALQRVLVDRMHTRQLRLDMHHQLNREVPSGGDLQDIEVETVVDGEFTFDDENDGAEGICTVCDTKCSLNYEMFVLDHQWASSAV